MTAINGGSATSFAELILQDAVDFDICVPEQVTEASNKLIKQRFFSLRI